MLRVTGATPLLDLFLELCAIPSPPGEERAVAGLAEAEAGVEEVAAVEAAAESEASA